jgi:predicted permease
MSLVTTSLNQIVIMSILIVIGIICYKIKIIDETANKKLSDLLLNLVLPLLIFLSYQSDSSDELKEGLIISFILAFASHLIAILLTSILFPQKDNSNAIIERYSVIYSNCAFIGIPLINGMVGSKGVFYLTAYITAFNVLLWTHGVIMIVGRQDLKKTLKTLISPNIVAIFFGLLFFIIHIRIPDFLHQSLNYIASMNTPLAMLIAGVTIGQSEFKKVFGKIRIYYVALIKLLLLPAGLLLLYSLFPIDRTVLITSIISVACPTAAVITLFALRYDKDALYASEIFAVTTLLSMITIPLIMALAELVI